VARTAFSLAVLLRLKLFLKQVYQLENEKCQTFQTANSTKAQETPVVRNSSSSRMVLELPTVETVGGWKTFQWLWGVAKEDQEQLDFDWSAPKKPRSKKTGPRSKRGGKKKKEIVDSGDEELMC
jgi:hypothetical protein